MQSSIPLFLLKGKHNINLCPANKSPKATDTFSIYVVISTKTVLYLPHKLPFFFLNLLWVADHLYKHNREVTWCQSQLALLWHHARDGDTPQEQGDPKVWLRADVLRHLGCCQVHGGDKDERKILSMGSLSGGSRI